MTPDGLVTFLSSFGPKETLDRLAAAVATRGITILARIDHAAAAAEVGLALDRRSVESACLGRRPGESFADL